MSDVLSTFTLGDYKAEVIADYDVDHESPRDFDGNNGVLVMPHPRYVLGDPTDDDDVREVIDAMERVRGYRLAVPILMRWIKLRFGARFVWPVGLGDHSGLWTYLGGGAHWSDPGGWDSGTIGFFFDTAERLRANHGDHQISDADLESWLRTEHDEYAKYLRGEVYGVRVYREVECDLGEPHEIDEEGPVWGVIGSDYAAQMAKENLLSAVHPGGLMPFTGHLPADGDKPAARLDREMFTTEHARQRCATRAGPSTSTSPASPSPDPPWPFTE